MNDKVLNLYCGEFFLLDINFVFRFVSGFIINDVFWMYKEYSINCFYGDIFLIMVYKFGVYII